MSTETLAIEHRRFGRIEVAEADSLVFDAMPGFPEATRFALLAHDRESGFAWLVSLEVPDLAFAVTDPWQFFADYEPSVGERELQALGAKSRDEVDLLTLVTLRGSVPTLNLLAPLLVCGATRRGLQLILDDASYSTAQPLALVAPSGAEAAPEAHTESKPQT